MQEDETPDATDADFGIRYDDDGTVNVRFSANLKDEIPEEIRPQPRYVFEQDDVVHFSIPSPDVEDETGKLFSGDEEQLEEAYEAAKWLESRLQDFSINLIGELLIAIQHTEEFQDFASMEEVLERLFQRDEFDVEVEVTTRRKDDNDGE